MLIQVSRMFIIMSFVYLFTIGKTGLSSHKAGNKSLTSDLRISDLLSLMTKSGPYFSNGKEKAELSLENPIPSSAF